MQILILDKFRREELQIQDSLYLSKFGRGRKGAKTSADYVKSIFENELRIIRNREANHRNPHSPCKYCRYRPIWKFPRYKEIFIGMESGGRIN